MGVPGGRPGGLEGGGRHRAKLRIGRAERRGDFTDDAHVLQAVASAQLPHHPPRLLLLPCTCNSKSLKDMHVIQATADKMGGQGPVSLSILMS